MFRMHAELWGHWKDMMEFSEKFTELLGSQDLVLPRVCEKW